MADYYSENESSSESSADSTVERNNSSSSFASSVVSLTSVNVYAYKTESVEHCVNNSLSAPYIKGGMTCA